MSRLPVSGLPSSTTDQSSAAAAAHIQPSNTQANGILEQIQAVNGLEDKLFKKTKSKKSDGYICGQWYHTALFILKWGEESYYYICVRLH